MLTPKRRAVALAVATVSLPAALLLVYAWKWPDGTDGGAPSYVAYPMILAVGGIAWGCFRLARRFGPRAYHAYDRTVGGLLFALVLGTTVWVVVEKVGEADWIAALFWSGLAGFWVHQGLRHGIARPLKRTQET